jgi:ankyrin repeat protein
MEKANQLKGSYPLHFAILENDINALNAELQSRNNLKEIIDRPDPHGRTPVMLATMLGRLDLAEMLLDNGANANTQNKGFKIETNFNLFFCINLGMWSLSHEAILTKDSNFLKKVLTLRNYQQAIQTTKILRETNRNFKVQFYPFY